MQDELVKQSMRFSYSVLRRGISVPHLALAHWGDPTAGLSGIKVDGEWRQLTSYRKATAL